MVCILSNNSDLNYGILSIVRKMIRRFFLSPSLFTGGGLLGNRHPGPKISESVSMDFVMAARVGGLFLLSGNILALNTLECFLSFQPFS